MGAGFPMVLPTLESRTCDQLIENILLQGASVVGDMIAGGGGPGKGAMKSCTQETTEGMDPTASPGKNSSYSPVSIGTPGAGLNNCCFTSCRHSDVRQSSSQRQPEIQRRHWLRCGWGTFPRLTYSLPSDVPCIHCTRQIPVSANKSLSPTTYAGHGPFTRQPRQAAGMGG